MSEEHERPAAGQEIQLQNLQLHVGTTQLHYDPEWVAYAVNTALPVDARNVDWSRNPRFGDGDEGRTAYA